MYRLLILKGIKLQENIGDITKKYIIQQIYSCCSKTNG